VSSSWGNYEKCVPRSINQIVPVLSFAFSSRNSVAKHILNMHPTSSILLSALLLSFHQVTARPVSILGGRCTADTTYTTYSSAFCSWTYLSTNTKCIRSTSTSLTSQRDARLRNGYSADRNSEPATVPSSSTSRSRILQIPKPLPSVYLMALSHTLPTEDDANLEQSANELGSTGSRFTTSPLQNEFTQLEGPTFRQAEAGMCDGFPVGKAVRVLRGEYWDSSRGQGLVVGIVIFFLIAVFLWETFHIVLEL
jgi:hypothetical protein